jgi:hypothetical protein
MKKHHADWLLIGLWMAFTLAGCGSGTEPNEPTLNLEEFQVNTSVPANGDARLSLAAGPDGSFLAVWNVLEHPAGGGTRSRIVAQRIDPDGRRAGSELAVSQPEEFGFFFNGVTPAGLGPQGAALFGYHGITACNPFCTDAIFARRYQTDGTPAGASFLIATTSESGALDPASVGVSSTTGAAVLVWCENPNPNQFTSTVKGQRLAADGSKIGGVFSVNHATLRNGGNPLAQVEVAPDGSFLVTWRNDADRRAQRYGADGTKIGAEFGLGQAFDFDVTMGPGGQIVYVRAAGGNVLMQRFGADGARLGAEVQVNAAGGFAGRPRASVAPDGKFAVAWAQAPGNNSGLQTIRVQRFAADGSKTGSVVQASTGTPAGTDSPGIALASSGRLLVTWVNLKHDTGASLVPDSVRGRLFAE